MPRYFFGIDLPPSVKTVLRDAQTNLQSHHIIADGWSNPDLLHVTSLFIGIVDMSFLPLLDEAGRAAARCVNPFELTTGQYGVFAKNKVLWLGLAQASEKTALTQLHLALLSSLTGKLPVDFEERAYRPHLTLARKLKDAARLKKVRAPEPTSFVVNELCLFESLREDGQLVYPIRQRYPLGEGHGEPESEDLLADS